jgi:hypothetical protein
MHPRAAVPCPACHDLPAARLTFATGYGETLPAAYGRLTSLVSGSRAALAECPACRTVFVWEDQPQFYGSGNLDEEVIERLDQAPSELVRAFVHDPDPTGRAGEIFTRLERPALDLLLDHLLWRRKDVFRALLPLLLDELARAPGPPQALGFAWLQDLVTTWAGCGAEQARAVLDGLAARRGWHIDSVTRTLRARQR